MAAATQRTIRIGCSSGFWGDSPTAAHQLMTAASSSQQPLDYLVADYLAEVTMGLLARATSASKSSTSGSGGAAGRGFVNDFLTQVYTPLLSQFANSRTRIVTNAGAMDPLGLKAAIEAAASKAGVAVPRVAAVYGDSLLPDLERLCEKQAQGHEQVLLNFATEGEQEQIPSDKVRGCSTACWWLRMQCCIEHVSMV
jgi:hypothetical protein